MPYFTPQEINEIGQGVLIFLAGLWLGSMFGYMRGYRKARKVYAEPSVPLDLDIETKDPDGN